MQRVANLDVQRHGIGLASVRELKEDLAQRAAVLGGVLTDAEDGGGGFALRFCLAGRVAVDVPIALPPRLNNSTPRNRSERRLPLAFLTVAETMPLANVAVLASSLSATGGA